MKRNTASQKKQQLVVYATQLNDLLKRNEKGLRFEITRLYLRVKQLIQELKQFISYPELRKTLGAAAILFGFASFNTVSAQKFEDPVDNPFGLDTVRGYAMPAFVDLDGDGDLDLLVGEYEGNWQYFENTGSASSPSFADPVKNPYGLDTTSYFGAPAIADLDGDGDFDLLAGSYYGEFQYFENVGTATAPSFAQKTYRPFGLDSTYSLAFPSFADLDDDGDYDLISGVDDGIIQYYKNVGTSTNPSFALPVDTPFGLDTLGYSFVIPNFMDLDSDGDYDILASGNYGKFKYYENIGSTTDPKFQVSLDPFGMNDTITEYHYMDYPCSADLDGDGDLDVLTAGTRRSMRYWEQDRPTAIQPWKDDIVWSAYPNPVSDVLHINTEEPIQQIEILNVLGQAIQTQQGNTQSVQLGHLKPGPYVLRLTMQDGAVRTREIVRE